MSNVFPTGFFSKNRQYKLHILMKPSVWKNKVPSSTQYHFKILLEPKVETYFAVFEVFKYL